MFRSRGLVPCAPHAPRRRGDHLCEHPRQPLLHEAAALPGPGAPGGRRGRPRGQHLRLRADRPGGHGGGPAGGGPARTGPRGAAGPAGAQEEGGPSLSGLAPVTARPWLSSGDRGPGSQPPGACAHPRGLRSVSHGLLAPGGHGWCPGPRAALPMALGCDGPFLPRWRPPER